MRFELKEIQGNWVQQTEPRGKSRNQEEGRSEDSSECHRLLCGRRIGLGLNRRNSRGIGFSETEQETKIRKNTKWTK